MFLIYILIFFFSKRSTLVFIQLCGILYLHLHLSARVIRVDRFAKNFLYIFIYTFFIT